MKKILVVFGTRPEAIKLAPVISLIKRDETFNLKVCVTGQHRDLLTDILDIFSISPDYNLKIMKHGQSITHITSEILLQLEPILVSENPDIVMVHGDTTTALSSALAAFYKKIRIAHVEAGLRTKDIKNPFPEEMNRRMIASIADYHFAPTKLAKENLLSEGVDENTITVTGNTAIDALQFALQEINNKKNLLEKISKKFSFITQKPKIVLVTAHRREQDEKSLAQLCSALKIIAAWPDVHVVFPVHPSNRVKDPIKKNINPDESITLIPALSYHEFVFLLKESALVMTDSGGVQEESTSLGIPTIILREKTERAELLDITSVEIGLFDKEKLVCNARDLLASASRRYSKNEIAAIFGDGNAASRIRDLLKYRS